MENFIRPNKTICIIVNGHREICYSNIHKGIAEEYLKRIGIFNYLFQEDTISYDEGYYHITADKIDLGKEDYYLIIIESYGMLYKYAYKDTLTGLYNRNYWEQFIKDSLYRPIPKDFTLIMVDVDNLKSLNDKRGHLIGDKAIQIVGHAIRESIQKKDLGVRYGGDEFFVILESTKKVVAEKVIKRIREKIYTKGKQENIFIEISAGAACYNCLRDLDKMIERADEDLYQEKKRKKQQQKRNHKGNRMEKKIFN